MIRVWNKLLLLLALVASPAFAQVAPPVAPLPTVGTPAASTPLAPPAAIADAGYVLGVGDVIEVQVVGRGDYSARVRVQADGTVKLPLIETVKVEGQTPLKLSGVIAGLLKTGGFYANPVVNVDVAGYSSRYVTVLGEVAQPGLVPIDRAYRVSEIMARVGGARPSGADHVVVRRATGEEQKFALAALATAGAAEDPVINPGDKLYVPTAQTYYIYGQVASPGQFRVEPGMSLRKAIARSGGLTPSGSEKRVKVFRGGEEIKKYKMDDLIQPEDVVVVGERFF